MQTEPEQWAVELLDAVFDASDLGSACGIVDCPQCANAALTIQRAFEERERELREALWTPSEAAWSGLARDLMMAFDMGCRTPREIFKHLERCGKPIPEWIREEGEMKHLDHVPSKGTRAVIIYRAMLEPALATRQDAPVTENSHDH